MAVEPSDPYALPYPLANDLADVPKDIKALALKVTEGLNRKQEEPALRGLFQSKIKVVTSVPTSTAGYIENDVVFVLGP